MHSRITLLNGDMNRLRHKSTCSIALLSNALGRGQSRQMRMITHTALVCELTTSLPRARSVRSPTS